MTRPTVLICCDFFAPGFKAGGPVQSLGRLVARLGDRFRFRVVTRDRDLGDTRPYPSIVRNRWIAGDGAEVFYASPRRMFGHLLGIVRGTSHDLLYLNSCFSPWFSIAPLLVRRSLRSRSPVILAPRGELQTGALAIHSAKKRAYLLSARSAGWLRDITWHATTSAEERDVQREFGPVPVFVAPNLGPSPVNSIAPLAKRAGELKILFLGRVAAIKNLLGAIEVLRGLEGRITCSIVGPREDLAYSQRCEAAIATLPANVVVQWCGAVEHTQIPAAIDAHHVMFLPTCGESYGHAIAEALCRGRPVVISDKTPWRDLAPHDAGWDVPLEDAASYRDALSQLVRADEVGYRRFTRGALAYAGRAIDDAVSVELHAHHFRRLIEARV